MAKSILNPDDGGRSWPQPTQSDSVTKVCFYHSTQSSESPVILVESLSLLLKACAISGYDWWISGQGKHGGMDVAIVHTLLPKEQVFALIAKEKLHNVACIVTVETVMLPLDSSINAAIRQHLASLASTGSNHV